MTTGTTAPATPPEPEDGPPAQPRSDTWIFLPLHTAGVLSVVVFLTRVALDLFVAHGLYEAQHGLIALLDVTLSSWAFAEIARIDRRRTPVPLRPLTIAAGVQLALGVVRGLAVVASLVHRATNDSLVQGIDLGIAAVFLPMDAAMLLVISKLFIDAFSHTERVRADQLEHQMALTRTAAAELAAAHREQEATEARQRRALRRKLKSSLAASAVAHEIHLPLSTILLRTRLALEKGDGGRDTLTAVATDAQEVVRTIEKMKVLLRSVQSDHARVDLSEVVQSALVQFKWQMGKAGIAVESSGLGRRCHVQGDDVQILLAVSNVLRNAIESIVAGGRGAGRIAVSLRRGKESATLVIGDDGPGWSGAERDATPLSTTKPQGSGIGLYIVRTVVRNHRGKVALRRSPLGGAEIRLRFPLDGGPAGRRLPAAGSSPRR